MNYKDTLHLPQTNFPMRANLAKREPDILAMWKKINIYQHIRAHRKGSPKYVLHDGPPYANGQIHIGHAVNKVLKDIVCKTQLLEGKDVPYVPGWDCHGLPIEVNVEKKFGKAGEKITAAEFRAKCREYALGQIEAQKHDFLRLGIIGDWDNPYTTMDFHVEAQIVRTLGKIIAKGNFRRGEKPVHWCFDCKSALAEAEIEYEQITSPAIDVAFTFNDQQRVQQLLALADTATDVPIALVIWTTTPWTIPANRGLAFHPDFLYQLVECTVFGKKRKFIVAKDLLESSLQRWQVTDYRLQGKAVAGKHFERMTCMHPLYDRLSLCTLGEFVTLETGTGIVHSAPAYGMDDYLVGQRYGLEVDNPVQENGVYSDSLALFGGMHIKKANPEIVKALEQQEALVGHQSYQHAYPHCWRHKSSTIQRATSQWFIDLTANQLGKHSLAAVEQVKWIPQSGETRMQGMIEHRPDWCLSRQRTWGTPITIFYHCDTHEPHPRTVELIEEIAKRIEQNGIEAWFDLKPQELLGDEATQYRKVNDILDVWFDSGTTHQSILATREELHFPADMYLEGSDQHRGWFQSSLLTSVCINGIAPYKSVLTHGFTVDANGRKMSKSLGNIVVPQKVIQKLGADVLRLWISSTDFSGEMSISDEILQRTSDAYRRIRNTLRFMLGNTFDYTIEHAPELQQMIEIDRWMLVRLASLQQDVIEAYRACHFSRVYQKLHHFCIVDLGAFYLDIIKDRMYTCATDSLARRSAQYVLHTMVHALVRIIAPIMSFTAEEIWQQLVPQSQQHNCSIFTETWLRLPVPDAGSCTQQDWQHILSVKNALNGCAEQLRNSNNENNTTFGSLLSLEAIIYVDEDVLTSLRKPGDELRFALLCSKVTILPLSSASANAQRLEQFPHFACELEPSPHPKCERCWHHSADIHRVDVHRSDVHQPEQYPGICARCIQNLHEGEERKYI